MDNIIVQYHNHLLAQGCDREHAASHTRQRYGIGQAELSALLLAAAPRESRRERRYPPDGPPPIWLGPLLGVAFMLSACLMIGLVVVLILVTT
jgi:hypothetical protein